MIDAIGENISNLYILNKKVLQHNIFYYETHGPLHIDHSYQVSAIHVKIFEEFVLFLYSSHHRQ